MYFIILFNICDTIIASESGYITEKHMLPVKYLLFKLLRDYLQMRERERVYENKLKQNTIALGQSCLMHYLSGPHSIHFC